MISDVQLAAFANILGLTLFVLIIAFHWVVAQPETSVKNLKQKKQ